VAGAKINGKIADTDFGYKAEAAFNFGGSAIDYSGNAFIVGANIGRQITPGLLVANVELRRAVRATNLPAPGILQPFKF